MRDLIPVLRGETRQFRVGRIAFVRYMRCEHMRILGQQTSLSHACHVLSELLGVQVVAAGHAGTIGMVEDHHIKSQPVVVESLPSLFP